MNIDFSSPVPLIVIAFFAFLFLYILFFSWKDVLYFFFFQYLGLSKWFITQQQKQFILSVLNKIDYYSNLSEEGKKYFYNRLIVFMLNRKFFGDGIKMSDEIKIFIAACAVQITFRIRRFYIDHLQLIRVFPKAVWSQMVSHSVKGLTVGNGVMWLSWEDVKKGFDFPHDGINLGLHEMAHAFMLSIGGEHGSYHHLCSELRNWENASQKEFARLHMGEDSLFRKYGGTNMEEFFAVNVECFFEQPEEFSSRFPHIYFSLCALFNQDPLNKNTDYKIGFS